MTRTKTEFAGVFLAALALLVFPVWYLGQSDTPTAAPPTTGMIERSESAPLPVNDATLAGTVNSVLSEDPPPALPTAVLERDRAFINEAFPALSSWSVAEVKPLLSEAALNASTDAELAQVMTTLSARLGTLQYFDAPQPVETPGAFADSSIVGDLQPYAFTAYYEEGEAEVSLVLEKQQQHSSLYSFDIHVPN